jgi:hypothetical protein
LLSYNENSLVISTKLPTFMPQDPQLRTEAFRTHAMR